MVTSRENKTSYLLTIMVLIVFVSIVCRTNDSFFVSGSVSSVLLSAIFLKKRVLKITVLDCFILCLFLYEILLLFTSINLIKSFSYLPPFTIGIFYYFIIRLLFINTKRIKILFFGYSVVILILSGLSVFSFYLFKLSVAEAGFENLYDVKHLYHPIGNLTNVWSSYLISFLGISVLCLFYNCKNKWIILLSVITIVLLIYNIIISFSRGVYLSLGCFILSSYLLFLRFKVEYKMKVISIFVVISLLALTIPFKDDILRTLRITETVSQERSTSGRIEAGNVTKKIIAKIPLMGVGNGNFSLAANEFLHENDNNTYSNFGGNSLFQLIAEKGIIGLLMWMGILTQIIYLFVKEKDKSPTAYMIVVIFFVILIRELSFPVFFEYEGLQLTFFTLLAIFQNQTVDKSCDMPIFNFKRLSIISWIPVAIFTILLFLLFIHYKNEKNNNLFLVALKRGDLNNALTYIDRTKESTPYLINRSICHWELFKKNKDPRSLLSSKLNLQKAIEKNPYDMMLLHNLSVVLNEEGKKDSSLFILSELVTRFPNNALYQMTMFDSFYRNGNKKEAQMHILKAVQNSPGILETPLWQNLTRKDTLFTQKIIQTLKINDPELNAEPIMLAKYGKLLLNLGDTIRAKEYLTRSVSILPNLSRPWCYLGIIAYQQGDTINMKRYIKLSMLLDKEDSVPQFYSSILEGKKIDKIPYYTDCHFIHGKYLLKFRQWYQSNTLPEVGYITY